jgi:hypothetical protein
MSDQHYDDLRALFINTTLKRSPEPSNTEGLIEVSARILAKQGVSVDHIRAAIQCDVRELDRRGGYCRNPAIQPFNVAPGLTKAR